MYYKNYSLFSPFLGFISIFNVFIQTGVSKKKKKANLRDLREY